MCHAVGMAHEQIRSDRDDYVKVLWENIISYYSDNFKKKETHDTNAYDYQSIMQYSLKVRQINTEKYKKHTYQSMFESQSKRQSKILKTNMQNTCSFTKEVRLDALEG